MPVVQLKPLTDMARLFAGHPLTANARLSAWARMASWQVQSRLRAETIYPWVGGRKLAVRRGMTSATGNIYVGLYEFADMMLVLHFLRPGDLFLDIGANVGTYTVLASGVCGARTWAFEPDPETLSYLARNIAINRLGDLATTYDCALGPQQDTVSFTVGRGCENRIADATEENVRSVQQEKLDDVIGGEQPVMIKMDVEGHEEGALQGASVLLANPCLKVIELETLTPGIERMLADSGFSRGYYDPFSRRLSREPVAVKASNATFVRDWPFVEARLAAAGKIGIFGRDI